MFPCPLNSRITHGAEKSARKHPLRSAQHNPDPGLLYRAVALHRAGNLKQAAAQYQRYLRGDPGNTEVMHQLAGIGYQQEDLPQAAKYLQQALELAHLLHNAGEIEVAESIYRRVMGMHVDSSAACYGLAHIRKFSNDDAGIITEMETLLADKRATDADRHNIHFARGKIHDDCGHFDQAFSHYHKGNAIRHKTLNYRRAHHEAFITAIMGVFNRGFFTRHAGLGYQGDLPICCGGMPTGRIWLPTRCWATTSTWG